MNSFRGIFAGALSLIALQAVVSTTAASNRVGGLFSGLASIVYRGLDPQVALIPDLAARKAGGGSSSSSSAGTGTAQLGANQFDPSTVPVPRSATPTPTPGPAPVIAPSTYTTTLTA